MIQSAARAPYYLVNPSSIIPKPGSVCRIYKKIPMAKIALITCLALGTLIIMADEIKSRKESRDEEEEEEEEIRTMKKITMGLNVIRWFFVRR